jgi:hypothetical protein
MLDRLGLLAAEIEADVAARLKALRDKGAAGEFATVQRQAPALAQFSRSEAKRHQELAIQKAENTRAQKRKVLDAGRSVADALAKRGSPVPADLLDLLERADRVGPERIEAARSTVDALSSGCSTSPTARKPLRCRAWPRN